VIRSMTDRQASIATRWESDRLPATAKVPRTSAGIREHRLTLSSLRPPSCATAFEPRGSRARTMKWVDKPRGDAMAG
jgi:hypothetical protein